MQPSDVLAEHAGGRRRGVERAPAVEQRVAARADRRRRGSARRRARLDPVVARAAARRGRRAQPRPRHSSSTPSPRPGSSDGSSRRKQIALLTNVVPPTRGPGGSSCRDRPWSAGRAPCSSARPSRARGDDVVARDSTAPPRAARPCGRPPPRGARRPRRPRPSRSRTRRRRGPGPAGAARRASGGGDGGLAAVVARSGLRPPRSRCSGGP